MQHSLSTIHLLCKGWPWGGWARLRRSPSCSQLPNRTCPLISISAFPRRPKPSPTTTFPCSSVSYVSAEIAKLNCKKPAALAPVLLEVCLCNLKILPVYLFLSTLGAEFCWFLLQVCQHFALASKKYYICLPRY